MSSPLCPMRPLTTAVTALRFIPLEDSAEPELHNTLFAGIGNQLHVLQPGIEQALAVWAVLPNGERLHSFSEPVDNRVIVTGGRYLSVVYAKVKSGRVSGGPIVDSAVEFDDWLWGSSWVVGGRFLLAVCGHSKVWVCDARSFSRQLLIQSSEKELTWSTTLFLSADRSILRAAAGTSFGNILVWNVLDAITEEHINKLIRNRGSNDSVVSVRETGTVHRLCGHEGPIMKVKVSREGQRMISASVDRTVRIWEAYNDVSCQACPLDGCFRQKFVHYGHLARVWDVSFLQEGRAGVVSVAEDRTCRIWSGNDASQQIAAYRGHAGRNVWSLDVQNKDDHTAQIATGGEDGCVKIRTIPLFITNLNTDFGVTENSRTESCGSRRCKSATYEIPDVYANPRKNGGTHNESGRTLLLLNDRELLISTDFGRILCVIFDPPWCGGQGADNETVSWIELYRDTLGVAYTPSSLSHCKSLVFAGQTNGNVTVLKCTLKTGELPTAMKVGDMAVFLGRNEMVMGLFAASSLDNTVCHLFAATVSGELFHWKVNLENDHGVDSMYCNTYRQKNPTKTAVVTSVAYIAELEVVIVGDRGGRVLVYDGSRCAAPHKNGGNRNVNEVIGLPSSICRPHQDRVSTILQCSLTTLKNDVERSKDVTTCDIMTGGFDGSLTRIQLSVSEKTRDDAERELSLHMVSKQKSIEHVDTIGRLIFPHSSNCDRENEQVFSRQCVVGFRSAHVSVWDVQQRNEMFRKNCGNWRRAYDVCLNVRCDGGNGTNGRLTVERMRLVFWRSGRLHVVRTLDKNRVNDDVELNMSEQDITDDDGAYVQTIGAGFHGQRANTLAWFEGTDVIVSGSEDTSIYVTRLKDGQWETIQRLSRHISGVNCVSWITLKDGRKMLFSGGGSDEVVGWISDKPEGPWKDVCGMVMGRGSDVETRALQRVICVVGVGGDLCKCDRGCGIAVVGRSDGSMGTVRVKEGKGFRLVGKEWDGQVMQNSKGHKGAILCCAGKTVTLSGGKGFLVLTGDSRGDIGIWWIDGRGACEQRNVRLLGIKEGVHDGGLNDVDIGILEGGKIMVVSGGDDERVRMGILELRWENGVSAMWAEWDWTSSVGLHSAAVTGVCVVEIERNEVVVVSVGADQRVNWLNARREGEVGNIAVGGCERSNVSDVAAVCGRVVEKEGSPRLCAVVCGCGMEAVWKRR